MSPYRVVHKEWLRRVAAGVVSLIAAVGIFNGIMDPLWFFPHALAINNYQCTIDDRQQKTNRLTFREADFDTLILGSSRTTYINQHDLIGKKSLALQQNLWVIFGSGKLPSV